MRATLQKLSAAETDARSRLKEMIRQLPDSPEGVRRLGPRCVVVPFSLIGKHGFNLSAGYWITAETKEALVSLVDGNRSLESLTKAMEEVIETGRLKTWRFTETIPPNVIAALKQSWEGV